MRRIAFFASGSGTNVENIIKYFSKNDNICPTLVLSNRKDAFVLERAKNHAIPSVVFSKNEFYDTTVVRDLLVRKNIDLIVLAGFMMLIPSCLIQAFPKKIINIHPALLPKFGGKGMYGDHVHEAVIAAGEEKSGITIHYVNEVYDDGEIIFQAGCDISPGETPGSLAEKIHRLEYEHYPQIIEKILSR